MEAESWGGLEPGGWGVEVGGGHGKQAGCAGGEVDVAHLDDERCGIGDTSNAGSMKEVVEPKF